MPVPRLELQDIEAVLTKEVQEGGRISGLGEYVGRRVLVVVPVEEAPAKSRGSKRGPSRPRAEG